ncbi:hypothetical protein SAY87_000037 [Trapa incisa]|uniref:Beta-amylase n=1 Tax=Trapa incisa TaxID=236973 RepID=A0AAN7GEQ8_9MYRT|nr:hypothetical protein SAY87_000037 [Trapa incisa]
MALTLRSCSSTSFINLKDTTKSLRNNDDLPCALSFPNRKPSSHHLRPSMKLYSHEVQATHARTRQEKLHALPHPHVSNDVKVPVFVMLPLDTVTLGGNLSKPRAMNASLMALRSAGVEGVMVDVWWGLVEKDGPTEYNWEGYAELIKMVARHGLKLQMVMSFHQCGGNVGDSCSIPLPPWVLEEMSKNPDLVYTDRSGRRNPEYISLGCDTLPVLRGRTPIQVYTDYMRSFRNRFADYLGTVIAEIQVGMGPCGELRYPAYPESNGTWRFPGIGEFQCYDKDPMILVITINFPKRRDFFRRDGAWNTEYGQFFLEWYSSKLVEHGDRILAAASGIFQGTGAKLSGKVAGIHWHYRTRSHAAELTAGYYNTRYRDGYIPIARMMRRYGVVLNFTCIEMKDVEQNGSAGCSPQGLVQQVKMAAQTVGTELAGENALERYDPGAFAQVLATSRSGPGNGLSAFTYLRMNKRLFEGDNWRNLVEFVKSMSHGGGARVSEMDSGRTDLYVGFVKKKTLAKENDLALV